VSVADRLLGISMAVTVLAGIAWASNASIPAHRSSDAVLRVAWSALPERVETCREASADELARLPPHMRQRLVCEGAAASYRLTVRAAGAVRADRVVRAGGLRHDRRLYVFEEVRLPAGEADIDVRFDRVEAASATGAVRPSASASPRRSNSDAAPPHLAYAERVSFVPGRVVLVTYDAGRRNLIAVTPPEPPR
jgi:hypothetical protein